MEYAKAQCNASAEHTPLHTRKPQSAASSWPGASVVRRRGVGSKTAQRIKADLAVRGTRGRPDAHRHCNTERPPDQVNALLTVIG